MEKNSNKNRYKLFDRCHDISNTIHMRKNDKNNCKNKIDLNKYLIKVLDNKCNI
jgi:hypothetical protein